MAISALIVALRDGVGPALAARPAPLLLVEAVQGVLVAPQHGGLGLLAGRARPLHFQSPVWRLRPRKRIPSVGDRQGSRAMQQGETHGQHIRRAWGQHDEFWRSKARTRSPRQLVRKSSGAPWHRRLCHPKDGPRQRCDTVIRCKNGGGASLQAKVAPRAHGASCVRLSSVDVTAASRAPARPHLVVRRGCTSLDR